MLNKRSMREKEKEFLLFSCGGTAKLI